MLKRRPPSPRPPGRPATASPSGVTLLELLLVILMIGILSAVALTRLDWERYQADAVGRGAMGELATAQRLALSLQSNMVITIPDSATMEILEDVNNDGTAGAGERVRTVPLENHFYFGTGGAPAVPPPDDGTPLTDITFHRDGSADRSGAFYLHGPGYDPDCRHCRAVAVSRATGRVVWYSYATGTWKRAN